ncbi:modulator of smoothened protein isoform X4 [Serinus canaria]|uniref:modulator of smoothened protein isoform X4 n=1 Tax=Serinus canaria TaxID=9135 RepID=UPI0021CCFB63|nr:modulator of smoothened protein isoform X4 [Serinus canaria]XP_059717339.1 modulator of smoothened protein isoform X3 [Haemorhous mexicanus]
MDKLTIISGCLFLAADIFAIASLANPDWINTGESAVTVTGEVICPFMNLFGLHAENTNKRRMIQRMKIYVPSGPRVILFCMAALIFPIGFYINEVGGQPYKLPNNTVVGSSYVLFVLSIFFTIVGLLFAGKVCLPG